MAFRLSVTGRIAYGDQLALARKVADGMEQSRLVTGYTPGVLDVREACHLAACDAAGPRPHRRAQWRAQSGRFGSE